MKLMRVEKWKVKHHGARIAMFVDKTVELS